MWKKLANDNFLKYYILLVLVNLLCATHYKIGQLVFKPLLVGSLLALYIFNNERQRPIFLVGVLAAIIGDTLLIFDNDPFFIGGLLSFLVMQLCYIATFRPYTAFSPKFNKLTLLPWLVYLGFMFLFFEKFGTFKWPVVGYAFCLSLMVTFGMNVRLKKESDIPLLQIGVSLFMISDLILAINKFVMPTPNMGIAVLSTYAIGQYLIVKTIRTQHLTS